MKISRINKLREVCSIGIAAGFAVGLMSTALAGPPSQRITFGPFPEDAFPVADCDGFQVIATSTINGHFILHFDSDGNVSHVNQHINFRDSIYFNSAFPGVFILGGPGENVNQRFDDIDPETGDAGLLAESVLSFKVTIPGYGVVFHQAGRFVVDLVAGEVVFQAGPADFDEGETAALCAALTPI